VNIGPGQDLLLELHVAFKAVLPREGSLFSGMGAAGHEKKTASQKDHQDYRKQSSP
jgi:hypothetical protein